MTKVINILGTVLVALGVIGASYGTIRSHTYTIPMRKEVIAPVIYEVEPEPIEMVVQPIPEIHYAAFEPVTYRNFTFEEQELLERIAMAESGNQDVIGKMLVMMTVINRAEKSGMSIRDVIYAPNQYYTQGMAPGDEGADEAIAMIMDGWDESQGALYFRTGHYHNFGTPLFQYGAHYFSK